MRCTTQEARTQELYDLAAGAVSFGKKARAALRRKGSGPSTAVIPGENGTILKDCLQTARKGAIDTANCFVFPARRMSR
ncbi:MAG: hypothetical protein LBU32_29220 [Clostridiales bacterium]|nr:hypothetical protein [Clostridiales bacterium]